MFPVHVFDSLLKRGEQCFMVSLPGSARACEHRSLGSLTHSSPEKNENFSEERGEEVSRVKKEE